jgi:hypothetical protein
MGKRPIGPGKIVFNGSAGAMPADRIAAFAIPRGGLRIAPVRGDGRSIFFLPRLVGVRQLLLDVGRYRFVMAEIQTVASASSGR